MFDLRSESQYLLASALSDLLAGKNLYLATAESCTGGGIAEAITSIPGSSGWFDRAFVVYSNTAKMQMLGVRETSLRQWGAVSERVAKEMALGAFKHSDAAFTVAVTGIAGPGGGDTAKPVGTVWFAWCIEGEVDTACMCFAGDREEVRSGTVTLALQGLVARIRRWLDEHEVEEMPTDDATAAAH